MTDLAKRPGDWDDDEDEFAGRDPTLEECIRLWHQGIEWYGHDTLLGIREFAGCTSETSEPSRRTWIASVQRLRAAGLFDTDTSYNLLYYVVDVSLDYQSFFDDPTLSEISDRMESLCRAHGLPDDEDFTPWPNPPAEWTALTREFDEREAEMRREVLRDAGEHEMVRLMTGQAAEFRRRIAAVEARLEGDHAEARSRTMPRQSEAEFF